MANHTVEEMGKVAAAEMVLYYWATGDIGAREVQRRLRKLGVRLMDRLNPQGIPAVDAVIDGCEGVVTLTF